MGGDGLGGAASHGRRVVTANGEIPRSPPTIARDPLRSLVFQPHPCYMGDMITLSFATTAKADLDLLHAVEGEIRARQAAEDAVWAVAAKVAEDATDNPYLGAEATEAFLREQAARAEAEGAAS